MSDVTTDAAEIIQSDQFNNATFITQCVTLLVLFVKPIVMYYIKKRYSKSSKSTSTDEEKLV